MAEPERIPCGATPGFFDYSVGGNDELWGGDDDDIISAMQLTVI